AILDETKALITAHRAICFNGNGYSDEWKEEAARRGLDCETSAPKIFDAYLSEKVVDMFGRTGVFSPVELAARNEVKWEMYTKKIQIEARVLGDLAINHVLPVATRYQSVLLDNLYKIKTLFSAEECEKISAQDKDAIVRMSAHMAVIREEVQQMVDARKAANCIACEREKALAYHDNVLPHMETIRYHIDKLELHVDDEMWPLPKYRELLFIR
ncbi:MAG: glutamine synthetase type III, partial [Muribaculaceae bacterium]|nr:glutamine synthetase type III [Muribaculaceae bacterium]